MGTRLAIPQPLRNAVGDDSDDTGALILFTSPALIGRKIDLTPSDARGPAVRSTVCQRDLPQGVSVAAAYPHLRPGMYAIEGSDQRVRISGGCVITLDYLDECCRIYYHPSSTSVLTDGRDDEFEWATIAHRNSRDVDGTSTPVSSTHDEH
ncbi:MAG: hypothetical protein HIU57_00935 [Acidobacteria bacterium]|nr:hypothetical protein [Acidobacteriota bacterium]